MKKLLLLLLFSLFLCSCATVEYKGMAFNSHKDEFIESVNSAITYDPYADKLYLDEEAITKAYQNFLVNTVKSSKSLYPDIDLQDGKPPLLGGTHKPSMMIEGIPFNYRQLSEYDIKKIYNHPNYSHSLPLNELKRWYWKGWKLKKIGPAKPSSTFEDYIIPLEITIKYYHSGFDKNTTHQTIKFEHRMQNPSAQKQKMNDENVSTDAFEDLKKLDELFKSGILTEEEYKEKKAKILDRI